MPSIQHYSQHDIENGLHPRTGDNTILIQIKDYAEVYALNSEPFIKPAAEFVRTYRFLFDDTEDEKDPNGITDHDAKLLGMILRSSYAEGLNVMVHCVAGLCRSAAVAVAGHQIGFDLEDKIRMPNTLVKKKIFQALGLYFDPVESPFATDDRFSIMKEEA
jgi:predicted protein tyrosine phosphatase